MLPSVQGDDTTTLRALTLNVWGGIPFVGRHDRPRMSAIGSELPRLAPDVVGFQEVWTTELRQRLARAARAAGLEHVWHGGRSACGGLMVASRLPLRGARFHRFPVGGVPHHVHRGDYWGGKGWVSVEVALAVGTVRLVVTHTQAQYGIEGMDVNRLHRICQILVLAAAVLEERHPVLALGDFNMEEGDPDYELLLGLTGFTDAARVLGNRQTTLLADNPYRFSSRESRIDYVFTRPGAHHALVPRGVHRVLDGRLEIDGTRGSYSDHAGLLVDLEMSVHSSSAAPSPTPAALASADRLLARAEALAMRHARASFITATLGLAATGWLSRAKSGRRLGALASVSATTLVGAMMALLVRSEHRGHARARLSLDALAGATGRIAPVSGK